jgi:cholesterol transport system auxiliary component
MDVNSSSDQPGSSPRRRGVLRVAIIAAMLALAGGCSSLIPASPLPTFDLSAPREFPRHGGGRGVLIVNEPTALAILDTDKIVVRPGGGQIGTLGGAQWSDRLPKLLQTRLVQSFENANRLRGVGRPGEKVNPDYQLVTDIRGFHLSLAGGPVAEVELSVKIVADRAGRVVAAKIFRTSIPAGSTDGAVAATAIHEAFQRTATDIVLWASRVI